MGSVLILELDWELILDSSFCLLPFGCLNLCLPALTFTWAKNQNLWILMKTEIFSYPFEPLT